MSWLLVAFFVGFEQVINSLLNLLYGGGFGGGTDEGTPGGLMGWRRLDVEAQLAVDAVDGLLCVHCAVIHVWGWEPLVGPASTTSWVGIKYF